MDYLEAARIIIALATSRLQDGIDTAMPGQAPDSSAEDVRAANAALKRCAFEAERFAHVVEALLHEAEREGG